MKNTDDGIGEDSDGYGDHAVGCGKEGERIVRHNKLRDATQQTARQASLAPNKEPSALLPGPSLRIFSFLGGLMYKMLPCMSPL